MDTKFPLDRYFAAAPGGVYTGEPDSIANNYKLVRSSLANVSGFSLRCCFRLTCAGYHDLSEDYNTRRHQLDNLVDRVWSSVRENVAEIACSGKGSCSHTHVGCSDDVLRWANEVLTTHSDRPAIILSHHVVNMGGKSLFVRCCDID